MLEQLNGKFPFDDIFKKKYEKYFSQIVVPAKTTLLKEGTVSKKAFFILQGCMRAWFNNDGVDVTYQFFFENSSVASIESFRKNIPSLISIETIEPCILIQIDKKNLDIILLEIQATPTLQDVFINAVFERTFDYMKHFLSFIKDSPEQRYLNLIKEKPQIIQRVPQHYIASYLGISKVHLSRIKNKLAKGATSFHNKK